MEVDLNGKVAFITGSTAGIGRMIALKMAGSGADIVLNGCSPDAAEEPIKEISDLGRKVIFEKADITDYQEVELAIQNALIKLDKIDILVVSGGATGRGFAPNFFHETDPADYPIYAKAQWWSRPYCVKAILNHMIERRSGKIIMLTTDGGRWPTPAESVVGGAGAAVVLATKVLAQELARWKIRINAVSTTAIEGTTSFEHMTQASPPLIQALKKVLEKQQFPLKTEDVAGTCLFFASSEADGITGQVLSVNGGLCFP